MTITMETKIHVERLSGTKIYNFLLNANDSDYQRWWKGTHLQFHTLKKCPNDIGNIVYMDEFIGKNRVKMKGVVIKAEPDKKITWQLKKLIRLPIYLCLELDDKGKGVTITHTIKAGFEGIGKIFDVFFRFYFTDEFEKAMDDHVRAEFPKLRDMFSSATIS